MTVTTVRAHGLVRAVVGPYDPARPVWRHDRLAFFAAYARLAVYFTDETGDGVAWAYAAMPDVLRALCLTVLDGDAPADPVVDWLLEADHAPLVPPAFRRAFARLVSPGGLQ